MKLKVFRGKSARKVLVQEVKSCGATSLIVGSSRKHHTIRSSASLAKYCARNLAKDVSVFAVKSGKIMFRRVPNTSGMLPHYFLILMVVVQVFLICQLLMSTLVCSLLVLKVKVWALQVQMVHK